MDHLLFAHANTTHHTEKLRPLGNRAVQTAGDHQHSRQQDQQAEHNHQRVYIFCHTVFTGPHSRQKNHVFIDLGLRELLFDFG